jgi:competence protein ComEA
MNNSIYEKGLAVVLIIAIIIMTVLGIKLSGKEKKVVFTDSEYIQENNEDNEREEIVVHVDVDGAVIKPGVYKLPEGSRVNDAIIMAGGLKENAITKNLNKARKLVDGEKIYIYEVGEETADVGTVEYETDLIDINTASADKLMTLPGIGKVYANRIIEYRNNKKFSSIEEIKNVKGIGEKTFENIKELIYCSQR